MEAIQVSPLAGPLLATPPLATPLLAIETSCDETASAILAPDGTVLAETLLSQLDHVPYQGVVPEIAARAHLVHLPGIVAEALRQAGLTPTQLGAVAATTGPGLIGGLLVGATYAKGFALAADKPFIAVNHLAAHALLARLPALGLAVEFPFLLLLVSGGHALLASVEGVNRFTLLGQTIDDAAGECFDKAARALGLGFPGGPALEALARQGTQGRVALPRPMLGRPGCDFSFSGLKTAVAVLAAREPAGAIATARAADIAAGFQAAMAAVLADRTGNAMRAFSERFGGPGTLVVAGGVAANGAIRSALQAAAEAQGFRLAAPPPKLCTDNAVMVGWAALEALRAGVAAAGMDAPCRPRWPLESLAA
jgi:N6-L-threonylcarbamoyladenine synthase